MPSAIRCFLVLLITMTFAHPVAAGALCGGIDLTAIGSPSRGDRIWRLPDPDRMLDAAVIARRCISSQDAPIAFVGRNDGRLLGISQKFVGATFVWLHEDGSLIGVYTKKKGFDRFGQVPEIEHQESTTRAPDSSSTAPKAHQASP